ncbi:von Willebrand factor A domain-containing protein 7-like [Electrophorus electricus]|uniref:von Willebrand factor A domain-containing protein 7-like n=1 Tax=Electrophorus electricus TaxID=8005 RepID=UPI0015CFEB3F|nr:von Willebrand factor A domain-containing protein 7-like [Electrophorus electricus]
MVTQLFLLSFMTQMSVHAFSVISLSSNTHQNITMAAILQKSAEVCSTVASQKGLKFVQPNPLTVVSLTAACLSPASAVSLMSAIVTISLNNAQVDLRHVFDPEYHFDNERFVQAHKLLKDGVSAVKTSLLQKNYHLARQLLGKTLHTLQDFYSHSNWIELGNRSPYQSLIQANLPIDNIADVNTPTCNSCVDNCTDNILQTILTQKKLTSGYFDLISSYKPFGKCSHGGRADRTSSVEPKGGINKDSLSSPHGSLHFVAADVAKAATRDLLQDIREAAGDREFLRLMGILQSSPALCFVIDTAVSMANVITEVTRVISFITDSRRGTMNEPSAYILVTFNDSEFGPLNKTTDPDVFKATVNALSTSGGGYGPEMSLSALWLALAAAPARSTIFLFTSAEAKDVELKSTVLALIETMKFQVNFILTSALSNTRKGLSNPVNQLYEDIALASGGEVIEVTKELLPNATIILSNSSNSVLVTIFQVARNPGIAENSFLVDSTVRNLTFYITANSTNFTIISPSGQSQTSQEANGPLGLILTVRNLYIVQLENSTQAGIWMLIIKSSQFYTLKVTGQSATNFLFDFVTVFQNPHPGYTVINSRPPADGNITLLLSMVGSDLEKPLVVALVEASDFTVHTGSLQDTGDGDYLVTVSTVPKREFYILVLGQTNSSSTSDNIPFQRQSSGLYRTSNITVTAVENGTLAPGALYTLPFTVEMRSTWQNYIITARNSLQYKMTFPSSLTAGGDGIAIGTVNLTAPSNATSGTEVILTIEAALPGGNDSNYVVLSLAVSRGVVPSASLVLSLWLSGAALFVSLLINNQI